MRLRRLRGEGFPQAVEFRLQPAALLALGVQLSRDFALAPLLVGELRPGLSEILVQPRSFKRHPRERRQHQQEGRRRQEKLQSSQSVQYFRQPALRGGDGSRRGAALGVLTVRRFEKFSGDRYPLAVFRRLQIVTLEKLPLSAR